MINKEFAAKNDIYEIDDGFWKKNIEDLTVLIEEKNSCLELTVPCASPTVDHQFQIEQFIRERTDKLTELSFIFDLRNIAVRIVSPTEEGAETAMLKAFSVLDEARKVFDLLPVCMCCERIADVELLIKNDRPITRCMLCRSEDELSYKQIKVREKYRKITEKERQDHCFLKGPVKEITKIGVMSGAYGALTGSIFMLLGAILPMFHYMPCFPGAVAGFYAGFHSGEQDNIRTPVKMFLVTVTSLLSLVSFSMLSILLLAIGCQFLNNPGDCPTQNFNIIVVYLNLTVGLGGYFLGEMFGSHMGYNNL